MPADFDQAVVALVRSSSNSGANFGGEHLEVVQGSLKRFLRATYWTLNASDLDDIVGQALVKFWAAITDGRVDADSRPAGYLVTIARNLALSELRRSPRVVARDLDVGHSTADEDDDIARMLESESDAASVKSGIAAAVRASDHTVVRVVVVWLDLAAQQGTGPSNRQVAGLAGVSHSAVRESLGRFLEKYLPLRGSNA